MRLLARGSGGGDSVAWAGEDVDETGAETVQGRCGSSMMLGDESGHAEGVRSWLGKVRGGSGTR